jgi:indole-3-glycerol phosphate synthase
VIGLASLTARKRNEVEMTRSRLPIGELESACGAKPAGRGLAQSLSASGGPTRIIAEIKRASPSAGAIRPDADVVSLSRVYRDQGASAISVLTDSAFGGSLDDLWAARHGVDVPLLRKDFIIDRYQLAEARCAGADAVLLIVAALPAGELRELHAAALALGLEVLVEAHDETEVEIALGIEDCRMIGLNSRNLATFDVDLATVERLAPMVGGEVVVVAESGIHSPADVARLRGCGFANFLVGEALMRSPDPGVALAELVAVR